MTRSISRRGFLKLAGSTVAAAYGASLLPRFSGRNLLHPEAISTASAAELPPNLVFAGTDGWIYLPRTPEIVSPALGRVHPDPYAPDLFTTYIFGFRNVTNMNPDPALAQQMIGAQKNKAQHNAPFFWVNEYTPATPNEFRMQLTNLGLAQRPDLFDQHTIHWHGFRNVIPFFDGEPTGSVSVPQGRTFTYVFRPRDPGTYMYHCHVEDTEHVHMGMNGLVFVRPRQNGNLSLYPTGKYVYNDGDGSTGYDREFAMHLSEVWADSHWADAHIQLPEWSDYRADFSLLNGRVYPDTLAPNGSVDPFNPVRDANGDLVAPAGRPDLQYQPYSSLVTCNAGERVLLRFANLGFKEAVMTLTGIRLRVIGRDATLMRGRGGANTSYETETLSFGAGESIDAIFTAPPYQGPGPYDTYMLYNRRYTQTTNLANGYGGQTTEVRVYPAGTLPVQMVPNT
jgi:FtsP/CotA-like multicopper oxidase with cupredoxin domain